ncbi:MAG: MarR family transcriptional regulator [Patescibacteria group bacterium]
MERNRKKLKQQVIVGAREYGIGSVLFRRVMGEMLGVNDTDMECLGAIFFKELTTPSELARYTGLSSGATTAMLDRLERSELIERRPNLRDRRSTNIVIAKKAAEKAGPLFASLRVAQEEIVSSYSEQELELLSDFFKKSAAMWEEERERLVKGRGYKRRSV